MEELRKDLETFQASEASRNEILKRILERLDAVVEDNSRLHSKLTQAEHLNETYHEDLEQNKRQLLDIKTSADKDPFILVLIDGDISLFKDEFIQRGVFGGHNAARALRTRIIEYLESSRIPDYSPRCKLVIKVYSKDLGLSSAYVGKGIASELHEFHHFVHGFNQEHALCEYIDAGNDKEAAGTKLKANLEIFYNNIHCKHILLGVSGDDSYASFLQQYKPGDDAVNRITLIKSLPFTTEFSQLAEEFLVTDMSGLFRSEKVAFDHDRPVVAQRTILSSLQRTGRPRSASDAAPIVMRDNEDHPLRFLRK